MGQYYIPTIMGPRYGVQATFLAHDYGDGLKLMEHSWMGNEFVGAVMTKIYYCPKRVAWIGDYSDKPYPEDGVDDRRELYQTKLPHEKFTEIYSKAMQLFHKKRTESLVLYDNEQWYLINHDRMSYVDLKKYRAANKYKPDWSNSYSLCVHPLPLLTACGNGRGGGDYHEQFPDFDKVGLWAFDLIELSMTVPNGYVEEEYHFKEE